MRLQSSFLYWNSRPHREPVKSLLQVQNIRHRAGVTYLSGRGQRRVTTGRRQRSWERARRQRRVCWPADARADAVSSALRCLITPLWSLPRKTDLGIVALAVRSGHGSGQWLSAALVALTAAGVFWTRLMRDLSAAS